MALQIWLPLTGDTRNRGVWNSTSEFYPSNTNFITVDNSGKLGQCYAFNSTAANSGIYHVDGNYMADHINNKSFSICAWIQTTATDTCAISLSYGLRLFVGDASHTYITLYNSSRTVGCAANMAVNDGKWHHVCAIYNVDTNKIQFYVDGVKKNEVSYTSGYTYASSWSNGLFIGRDPNNSTVNDHYLYRGKMNDIRVYDHALSEVEIKELAKGLVCHYKLDEFYSADNLIVNGFGELGSENWNNGSYISTTEIPPNHPEIKASMHSGNMTKQYIPIIQNHTYTISGYIKAMSGTTGNAYPSIYGYDIDKKFIDYYKCEAGFNSTYRTTLAQPLHKGDTVIYATDLSAWTTGDNHFYHVAIFGYQNSLGEVYPDMVYTQDSPAFGTKTDKSHIDKTNNTITLNAAFTGEDRPAGTTICQATEGSVYLYPWGGINVSTIPDWVFKTANFKPSTSSRLKAAAYIRWSTYGRCYIAGNKLVDIVASDDTIIDSSGYGYHGTKTGTLSPSIDTPRYSLSTNFPENSSTVTITPYLTNNQTLTEISVSCWYKTNTLNSTTPNLWSLGENSFLRLRLASTTSIWYYARVGSTQKGYTYTAGKTLTDNAWHHVVLTFKNGVFVVYVDGSQIGTSDASGTATYLTCANTAWHLAGYTANSENFIGNLSDFRIYTTCLSTDDVLRLYNTAASVAKTGAILGYEMKEG